MSDDERDGFSDEERPPPAEGDDSPMLDEKGFPIVVNRKLQQQLNPMQLKMAELKRKQEEERKKAEKAAKLTAMAGAFGGKLNDKDAGRRKEEEERKKKEAEEKARAEAEAAAKAPARLDSRTKEMMSSGIAGKSRGLATTRGRGRGRGGALGGRTPTTGSVDSPAATNDDDETGSRAGFAPGTAEGSKAGSDSDSSDSEDERRRKRREAKAGGSVSSTPAATPMISSSPAPARPPAGMNPLASRPAAPAAPPRPPPVSAPKRGDSDDDSDSDAGRPTGGVRATPTLVVPPTPLMSAVSAPVPVRAAPPPPPARAVATREEEEDDDDRGDSWSDDGEEGGAKRGMGGVGRSTRAEFGPTSSDGAAPPPPPPPTALSGLPAPGSAASSLASGRAAAVAAARRGSAQTSPLGPPSPGSLTYVELLALRRRVASAGGPLGADGTLPPPTAVSRGGSGSFMSSGDALASYYQPEVLLRPDEFARVFEVTPEGFEGLQPWQRAALKKKLKLGC